METGLSSTSKIKADLCRTCFHRTVKTTPTRTCDTTGSTLVSQLRARLGGHDREPAPTALVFGTREAGPLRRSNFRRQIWRPALVRAGLLGKVAEVAPDKWHAKWTDADGVEWLAEFAAEREAVDQVARKAFGGLRFHDLRHSYATWLISDGVPVNVVQRVMGHEQASTTLNLYVHPSDDHEDDVRDVFEDLADDSLTFDHDQAG